MSSQSLPYSMKDVQYDNAKFRRRSLFQVFISASIKFWSKLSILLSLNYNCFEFVCNLLWFISAVDILINQLSYFCWLWIIIELTVFVICCDLVRYYYTWSMIMRVYIYELLRFCYQCSGSLVEFRISMLFSWMISSF